METQLKESLDLFKETRSLEMVKKVSNLDPNLTEKGKINFIFFTCPKMNGQGLKLNAAKTGYTVKYLEGFSRGSEENIARVHQFINYFRRLNVEFEVKCIFASADAMVLFPLMVDPSEPAPQLKEIEVIANLETVKTNLKEFVRLYHEKPWQFLPARFWQGEVLRLKEMLPPSPENLKEDFAQRTLAGFALDGILIKQGAFGANPVILGVESPGVAVLQNAALSSLDRKEWLPVIQI